APPTDKTGSFSYPVDITTPTRHVATVTGVGGATIDGKKLTAQQSDQLLGRTTGVSVGYNVTDVSAHVGSGGPVVVPARLSYGSGNPAPPTVLLCSYELRGTITDSNGNPVRGAVVTTRTNDRQYWTQSRPSGANGAYASFLVAADQEGDSPVPMQVGVAV